MVNILLLWLCYRRAVWVVVWVCIYLVHYRFVSAHQDEQIMWRFGGGAMVNILLLWLCYRKAVGVCIYLVHYRFVSPRNYLQLA